MSRLTTCLWFDGQAEQAAAFYTSILPNSRVDRVVRSPGDSPSGSEGAVLTVEFTLDGDHFLGLNGGPAFTFNESISLMIDCRDQAEVDRYWDLLTSGGGEPSACGWLKDRFGLSWQVVPRQLMELLYGGTDPDASRRAFEAMLTMSKIEISELEAAYGAPAGNPIADGAR